LVVVRVGHCGTSGAVPSDDARKSEELQSNEGLRLKKVGCEMPSDFSLPNLTEPTGKDSEKRSQCGGHAGMPAQRLSYFWEAGGIILMEKLE